MAVNLGIRLAWIEEGEWWQLGSLFAGGRSKLLREVGCPGNTKEDWWAPALMERQIWKWNCTGWASHEIPILHMEKLRPK